MKKILFISPTGGNAGVDVCLESLILGSLKQYEPIALLPENALITPRLRKAGVKVIEGPLLWWFPVGYDNAFLLELLPYMGERLELISRVIKEENIDLVFSNTTVFLEGALAAAQAALPHICHMHATFVDNIYTSMTPATKEFAYRTLGALSTRIVCCSNALSAVMAPYIPEEKRRVVLNGVDVKALLPEKEPPLPLKIISAGHINPNKNQRMLIDAVGLLKYRALPPVTLYLAGEREREYGKELEDRVRELDIADQVIFMGFTENIAAQLGGYHVYANTSDTETFPVSVLEAMSKGLPVVATPTEGAKEMVLPNETGFLVNTPAEVADALEQLARDPLMRSAMGRRGRERCEELFSHVNYLNGFHAVFEEALAIPAEPNPVLNSLLEMTKDPAFVSAVRPRILLIRPPGPVPTSYMMGLMPLEALAARGAITFTDRTTAEVTKTDVAEHDMLYIIRYFDQPILKIMGWAQEWQRPCILFVDDDYSGRDGLYEKVVGQADCVLMCSERLETLCRQWNRVVWRIPPYQRIPTLPGKPLNRDPEKLTIGFMGTLGKEENFPFMLPAVRRILDEHPKVKMIFMGCQPDDFVHDQVRMMDFVEDYRVFLDDFAQQSWDIGLAPLADTPFNAAKTNNKFREYGALGMAGVYSQSPAYSTVRDQVDGLVVENDEESWYQAIKILVCDHELRQRIGHNAFLTVQKEYPENRTLEAIWEVFRGHHRRMLAKWQRYIEIQQGLINDQKTQLKGLWAYLEERDVIIEEKDALLEERYGIMEERSALIAEQQQFIEAAQKRAALLEARVQELIGEVEERDSFLNRFGVRQMYQRYRVMMEKRHEKQRKAEEKSEVE